MLRRLMLWLLQGSPDAGEEESFNIRRSKRLAELSQRGGHAGDGKLKTPVQHKHQLPSPVTHLTSDSLCVEFTKEETATPPAPRASQNSQNFLYSSQPNDTQPFSQQEIDPNAPLSDEVEDEEKEGVWGYLFPLDTRFGLTPYVLRKKDACQAANAVEKQKESSQSSRAGRRSQRVAAVKSVKAGSPVGFLIGRHPECDLRIDDAAVSNRHCLLFTENRGTDVVAVLEDLSTNGTYINDEIVGRNQRRELREHDEISIADNRAKFFFRYPKNRRTNAFLQQYTAVQELGKGYFAEVYLCIEKSTGQRWAVKRFTKNPGYEDRSKNEGLQQEVAMLMSVNHPNIVCLKELFNEPTAVYLVLEYCPGGELFTRIADHGKLTEGETRKVFKQLFDGVKYLHDRNIIHRDIKPENILLMDDQLNVKLADFGLAKIVGEDSFATTLCGTPSYVAPEVIVESRRRHYSKAVDIWSLGVVLYICLCGFPPFSAELERPDFPYNLQEQIKRGLYEYPSPYWDPIGDPALDLIDRMLVVKPERRYTIDQCLADPWLTQQQPGVNDSTNGLVSGLAGLEVNRRGVTRERTLLSEHAKALRAANHYNRPNPPHSINSPYKREMRPDDNRDPGEFMEMGGKGDQVLFEDNGRDAERAAAKHKTHAEAGPASPSHRKGGKGKGKGR
ncbi:uncharacterized protein CTHT_0054330 [Thermochaetoides thermophila DSM 1495]|uniref:Uncharacterized protein n=1 Tax=Chaetomium thermophilum (strain DSM 1495 / CBS 144.50 / IMI 039719) TaxID=759272 RepID=G0SBP7_CHATD|nr:hypothetical protein CTHT_0054330 [Thermochaetoides thermophila DSM 1495]EGS18823.1 hypothetical protein CTHT_0054330 [Thermochaetoides thermophila DSM 1495]